MSSGGKGSSSSSSSINYYGSLAWAFCWGPLDWLTAVVAGGNYLWQCSGGVPLDLTAPGVVNSDGYVDLTGGILDHTKIASDGYLRLFRGTSNQSPDGEIPGDSGNTDTVRIVARHIFFGQNSGSAPNLQLIGGRLPRVPTAIVHSEDNIVDDRQINPIAALAEILLDERGLGISQAIFEASSWQASAHWCAQDQAHRNYSFISPLINDQKPMRDIVSELLDHVNGSLRWTTDGLLACDIYEWGTDPGGLPILDERYIVKKPKFTDGDWEDIPTEMLVAFTDRGYEFQQNSVLVTNDRAAQIRGVNDQKRLERPHVTRQFQAQLQGVEYNRRMGMAPGTGTIVVRSPFATGLYPGAKFKLNDNPEPGGTGLAQLVRVEKIEMDMTDEVTLTVTLDPLLPATSYTPTWISPLPGEPVTPPISPPIQYALGIPLSPGGWEWPPAVGFLVTRPSADVIGFDILFGTNPLLSFQNLGSQTGFAARASLVTGVDNAATTLRLQLTDGAGGPDAYLAGQTPGGNLVEAQDDDLLAVLVQLDGNGRVAIDGNNNPIMEFVSIVSRSAVSADTHDYTVLRGRRGLDALAWTTGSIAWIVPLSNLVPWRHGLFPSLIGQLMYFRLVDFTSKSTDESSPPPEADITIPTAFNVGAPGVNGPDDGVTPDPVTGVAIASGVEMLILSWTNPNPAKTPIAGVNIYESSVAVRPSSPAFFAPYPESFKFRDNLASGTTKYYWFEVKARSGRRSTIVGPVSGTVVVWPVISGINATITGETSARIAADNALGASITEEATTRGTNDDSLAAEYVLEVSTGGGGQRRVTGFRITNLGGAGGSTEFIVEADLFAVVNSSGDPSSVAAPFAVESGIVYINTAMIKDATITSAMIDTILCSQIETGTIEVQISLQAALIATGSACYNIGAPDSTFPMVSSNSSGFGDSGGPSDGATYALCSLWGWATGSGFATDRFGKSDMLFTINIYAQTNFIGGPGRASFVPIYRINGGDWVDFSAGFASANTISGQGNGSVTVDFEITGLSGTEEIDFGIMVHTSGDTSATNWGGSLAVKCFNL